MGKKNTAAEQDSSAAAATDAHTTPEQKEREAGQTEGRRRRTDGRPQSVRPSVRPSHSRWGSCTLNTAGHGVDTVQYMSTRGIAIPVTQCFFEEFLNIA
jgi:hypothetical protein